MRVWVFYWMVIIICGWGQRYVIKLYEPTGQMPSLKAANAENVFRFVQLALKKSHSVMPN